MSAGKFYNEDCIQGARKRLKDDSVDLIITDPPYGIKGDTLDKHYKRDEKSVIGGYIDVPEDDYPEFSSGWIREAERVLKPGGSIYIISGYTHLRHILNALSQTKLIEKNHIIWKYNFGVFTSRKFISSHYHILYYVKKGNRPTFNTNAFYSDSEKNEKGGSMNYLHREDVWVINREYKPGEIKNKNELPKALLAKMILYSSNPDDLVCDFFLGSFSTAKIAIALGRNACGFEMNKTAYRYQMKEIKGIEKGFLLKEYRTVPGNRWLNRGKALDEKEIKSVMKDYGKLKKKGFSKKKAIEELSCKYKRGYWSLLNIIHKNEN